VKELKKQLELQISKDIPLLSTVLMSRFCFLDKDTKFTQSFVDPKYFPFFYYLGKTFQPKNLLEIGFGLGLVSGCFFQGCNTVEKFVAYQEKRDEFYSHRLGLKNIRCVYNKKFKFTNDIFNLSDTFDFVIINDDNYSLDRYRFILDIIWNNLNENGVLAVDHAKYGEKICNTALKEFIKMNSPESVFINTRYGTLLLRK
jgi:predicted O-methyltransferase YrrM